jgi:hypothetical protein
MPNDLEEKLSLTFTIQWKPLTMQARENGERMKVVLTAHSLLSCANGGKRCHILKKILRQGYRHWSHLRSCLVFVLASIPETARLPPNKSLKTLGGRHADPRFR